MRAHTVILGAGATMAAIPNGDKNGKKSSVMNGMISKLGLDDLLADVKLDTKSENIEDIYSELYMKPEYAEVVKELEKRLYDYFDSFEIPDTPTVYDFLILGLTEKDVIATFNWDPLLVQAYHHYRYTNNFFDSYLGMFPRRSCETVFAMYSLNVSADGRRGFKPSMKWSDLYDFVYDLVLDEQNTPEGKNLPLYYTADSFKNRDK